LLLGGAVEPLLAAPPKVNYLFPAGGQRGQTVKLTASGEFSTWPVEIWSGHPGVAATADAEKGKVTVTLEPDAQPGIAWLRFHTGEGASTLQPFIVGTLEEAEENEPNDAPSSPQPAGPRMVINGRLQKGSDLDGYSVSLKQGETLVAAVQAHTILGSPVDSVLQICELVERRSLPDAPPMAEAYTLQHDHDANGLDPRIIFTAPRDGDFLVRVFGFPAEPNSTIGFSGADNYVYRLTLTTGPYVVGAMPLAVAADTSQVQLLGWNLPTEPMRIALPAAATLAGAKDATFSTQPSVSHPEAAGFATLARSSHSVTQAASENSLTSPQAISVPITLSGQLAGPGTAHAFEIEAKKEQKLRIALDASSLGFPWDPQLAVQDSEGKLITEVDDAKKEHDPELVFSPPADGKYRIIVRDLAGNIGLDFLYRLDVEPVEPDFALSLAADSFVLSADKPAEISVTVQRRDGFTEPITIRVANVPNGVTAEDVVSEPTGESSKSVKLLIKAAGDLSTVKASPLVIEGNTADGKKSRIASFSVARPLASEHSAAWLSISR